MRLAIVLVIAALLSACAAQRQEQRRDARLVEIHTQLGAGYMQRNQFDIANQELGQALAIDPDNAQANNVMALLQARLKENKKADEYFRRALAAQPDNSDVHNNYGAFLCEQGRLDAAERHFKKALTDPLYRTPELANLNAGRCLMKKPAPAAAAQYFKAALAINPKFAPALLEMAKISFDSGQNLSARGYMQRYFEVAQDSPESLWLAIRIERVLRNKDLQGKYGLRLTAKYPDSPEAKEYKRSLASSK